MAALSEAAEVTADCSMIRRDDFFLEQRPDLIASRSRIDRLLAQLELESLDISPLHCGAGDAVTLSHGTATRYLSLAMKHALKANGGRLEDVEEEDVIKRCVVLLKEGLQHQVTYSIPQYSAAANWLLSNDATEDNKEGSESISPVMLKQVTLALRGAFVPAGTSKDGVPLVLLRPSEHFQEACCDRFVKEPSADGGNGEETWAESHFTSALLGIMDNVYRTASVQQSKAAGKVVDRLTILVDCSQTNIFLLGEIQRLCTTFFTVLPTAYAETTESVFILNMPFILRAPTEFLLRIFADEETIRRIQFFGGDYEEEMGEGIDADQMPEVLGGRFCLQIKGQEGHGAAADSGTKKEEAEATAATATAT